jgi:hypothetical protein
MQGQDALSCSKFVKIIKDVNVNGEWRSFSNSLDDSCNNVATAARIVVASSRTNVPGRRSALSCFE